jgi:DNA-binding winged helix-turn-helix (wHTH) protein
MTTSIIVGHVGGYDATPLPGQICLAGVRREIPTLEIDLLRFQVHRDGRILELQPLIFDLLVFLVTNRHRVVTRGELLRNVWGGAVVSDGAINQAVSVLRHALGSCGSSHDVIRTVHRRGYRFVATGICLLD